MDREVEHQGREDQAGTLCYANDFHICRQTVANLSSAQIIETVDPEAIKTTPLQIAPIEQQDDFESRKAWKKVADAIIKGDMDTTSAEKSIIENRQRAMRKTEKEQGKEWERTFFKRVEKDATFEKLVGCPRDTEMRALLTRFIGCKDWRER